MNEVSKPRLVSDDKKENTTATQEAKKESANSAKSDSATPSTKSAAVSTPKPSADSGRRGRPKGSKNKTQKAKATSAKAAVSSAIKKKTSTASATPKASSKLGKSKKVEQLTDHTQAFTDFNNHSTEAFQQFAQESAEMANKAINNSVEISKDFFACRTVSDVLEVQHRLMQNNMSNFFKQTSKFSEMMFEAASETAQPLNTSITEAMDKFTKKLSN